MGGIRAAVFLDRDGVLNALVDREGRRVSPRRLSDFHLFEEAPAAVRQLRDHGFLVFVTTNQPDIARGLMSPADLTAMTGLLQAAIAPDEVVVCAHDDNDGCHCRKPAPGMMIELAKRWRVDLPSSYVVGDSWRDTQAGRRAGCHTILVSPEGEADVDADATVPTLLDAVSHITAQLYTETS
jgi:D-glycero-D-manno-heptose 1,7-bisphosphate phosphatase